jgi:hypothetical protein
VVVEAGGEVVDAGLGDDGGQGGGVDGVMVARQVIWLSFLW